MLNYFAIPLDLLAPEDGSKSVIAALKSAEEIQEHEEELIDDLNDRFTEAANENDPDGDTRLTAMIRDAFKA